jgi:hypothetical protein
MGLDIGLILETVEVLENYVDKVRPPKELRDQLDVAYKIENQSVILFEIRPRFDQPDQKLESAIAKATFVKTNDCWKVFWQRADLKWHTYGPKPTVNALTEFVTLVEEDKYNCFWG